MLEYLDLLGKPFAYQGRGPSEYDCYGLLIELHGRLDVEIPDYKSPNKLTEIAEIMGREVALWKPLWLRGATPPKSDDIPLYSTIMLKVNGLASHVGMKIGPNKFVHTWEGTGGVVVERISLWKQKIIGVYTYDRNN